MTIKEIQKILLSHCRYIINVNGIPITGIHTRQTTELAEELFTSLTKSDIKSAEEFIRDEYDRKGDSPLEAINCEGHHVKWMMEEYAKIQLEKWKIENKQ